MSLNNSASPSHAEIFGTDTVLWGGGGGGGLSEPTPFDLINP